MPQAHPDKIVAAELRYPPERFVEDFSFLLEVAREHPRAEASSRLEAYYNDRWGVGSYNSENCIRLVHAFNYFMSHMSDFDTGEIAVMGDSGSLISHDLIYAFYRVFNIAAMKTLKDDFATSIFIDLANEQKQFNEKT